MTLDADVANMTAAAGRCESIGRTPHPIEYNYHGTRFLVVFCFTLPFVLAPLYGWNAVLVSMLVSYSLMGIMELSTC
eukprot:1194838-Prorocentrum_minimum.AAC.1